MRKIIEMPRSRFLKVMCKKCKHQQIAFDKPSTEVKCLNCGAILLKPKGGKGELIEAKIIKELS
jgi:small subunit ribosomal protein S27e